MVGKEVLVKELKEFNTLHQSKLRSLEKALKENSSHKEACVSQIECPSHTWFKERTPLLNKIFGSENIKALNLRHQEWHTTSGKICEILALKDSRNVGLLGKMFGKKQDMRDNELDIAGSYISELKEITKK